MSVSVVAFFATACNSDAKNKAQINLQAYKDSVKRVEDARKLDSFKTAEAVKKENAAAAASSKERIVYVQKSPGAAPVAVTQAEAEKHGWSAAAKGAVIGAGAGAVTGILVDKKDARGAIIGGVVGAGTGYVIGRGKDKKSGRAQ